VDNVRTRLASQWMWEDGQGWNWAPYKNNKQSGEEEDLTKMGAFYKWARMLQDRKISITLNAGWHLHDFSFFYDTLVAPAGNRKGYEAAYGDKDGNGHSSIPEVNYLHGYQTPSSEYTKGQLEINCDEKGNIINDKGSAFKYENKYGEDSLAPTLTQIGKDLNLFKEGETYDESKYAYFSVAAARYAVWIKQALNAFKANGVNNVKYVLPFTETGYAINMGKDKEGNTIYANDFTYDEWIFMTAALDYVLQDQNPTYGGADFGGNIRNQYKIIGPSQSFEPSSTSRISLVTHIYNKLNAAKNSGKFSGNLEFLNTSPLVNINSMHCYPKPDTKSEAFKNNGYTNSIFDPYATYSMADNNFRGYSDILKGSGVRDMEFWCDEYFASAPDSRCFQNVGMQMTQFAAGLTAGINNGINRFSTWQMFDTLWDSDATHGDCINTGSSEFAGGIHVCGTCPSLVHVDGKTCPSGSNCPCTKNYPISSYVPRTTYYGINLIGKYMNNNNAKVFGTQVQNQYGDGDGGVYVSAIENDEGKTVVLVVNTMPTTSSVNLEFDKEYTNFTRYTYDPNEVDPTEDATSLPSDKTITMENPKSFYDIIPAQSFAIYVEVKNEIYIGEDVDIEVD
ncbi:MAG: hypothetical protein U0L55_00815, partial [Acutalibacteraceae bacterium]|nr:hypothetical protein [Acutalibacteraceae bacterium]